MQADQRSSKTPIFAPIKLTDPRKLAGTTFWVLAAAAAFHAAYASARAGGLVILYLFSLLQLARAESWRKAFYSGLAVGFLIAVARLEFFWRIFSGGAIALWYVYAFWIGLFVALASAGLRRLPKTGWLIVPFLWTGLEYFRSELYYLRFSWLNVGYAFAGPFWQELLRRFGMYGVGFLLISAACVAAFLWQKSTLCSLGALVLAIVGTWLGAFWSGTHLPITPAEMVRVAGVQMEFPAEPEVVLELEHLIRQRPDTQLVVLSEYTFDGPVPEKIKAWCQIHKCYLVVGGKEPAPKSNFYNTAFVIGPTGEVVFRQVKSVPIQFFKDGLPAAKQQLWASPWGKIGICICYDLSYTRVTDRLIGLGAQALIVPTMDVADWGLRQHELHARVAPVRAAEYGVPIFRLASSGISQCINRSGSVMASAGFPGEHEQLAGTLALAQPGSLPLDRWLAPFATGVTALLMLFLLSQGRPSRKASTPMALKRNGRPGKPPRANSQGLLGQLIRRGLHWLLRLLYGFRACNLAALDTPGPVLLLPNHVSWWDWLLIGVCLEEDWRFVTSSTAAQASWFHRLVMVNRRTFPVDMNSPFALKRMAEYLLGGGRLVLFPEGRLSRTGSLMKLFEGTGFLISKTRARVITAYIRNAQRLPFSPNPGLKQWFPRLSVHLSPAWAPPGQQHVRPAQARARLMEGLRDHMTRQQFDTEMEFGPPTLPQAIAQTARQRPKHVVLQDATLQALTYTRLLVGADLLAQQWRATFAGQEHRIGVLLPNVNAMPVTLLSLWAAGKIPAILNYSTGAAILLTCAQLAGLKHIISSKAFLERLQLDLAPFKTAGIEFILLEDVRARISSRQKFTSSLRLFLESLVPDLIRHSSFVIRHCQPRASDAPAVILFTSGSEGIPKGVELTHRNLLANIRQMLAVSDFLDTDRFLNALPLFHSFGLTIGLLLPLVRGMFAFLYISPLHYRVVPAAFYNLDCTVLFGTNTFLAGYARKAHPYDFHALRYLFVGGEKVQDATAALWMRKFGVRVLEGYGATECGPCLTVNSPMNPRFGSAGQFLPAIQYKLEPVEGLPEDGSIPAQRGKEDQTQNSALRAPHSAFDTVGRLFVRGPNVMRGYVNPEANALFQSLEGWYDTGDIVKVDAEGFVFILGRLKRFAKVSGEMVSLTAVEDALAGAFSQYGPKFAAAIVAKPDEAKGEKLVAFTTEPRLTLDEVREALRARGLSNLAIPRELKLIHELPRLGTGKVNHRELEKLAP